MVRKISLEVWKGIWTSKADVTTFNCTGLVRQSSVFQMHRPLVKLMLLALADMISQRPDVSGLSDIAPQ